jgi:hypothetical protein
VGYWGRLLTLRARKQFREVRIRKFYVLNYKMQFLIIFSGYNEKVSVISYTCNRQRPFSDSSHKQCVPSLDNFGIESILHRRGVQRTRRYTMSTFGISFNLTALFPTHLLHRTLRKHETRLMTKLMVLLHLFLSSPRI